MKIPFVIDPKTKEESVSLTFAVVLTVAALAAAFLEMSGLVKNTSIILELTLGSWTLYFGRRFSVNGKEISSSEIAKIENKVEPK